MNVEALISYLSGALTLGFLLCGAFFIRFWRRTGDRLFLHFALGFGLFALNQAISAALGPRTDEIRYEYILRVLGFLWIIVGIVKKNAESPSGSGSNRLR